MHDKLFEADPNIQYTYAWDRLNEYRQVSKASFLAPVKFWSMLEWKATCSNSCVAAYPHQDMRGEGKGDYPVCLYAAGRVAGSDNGGGN